MFVLRHINPSRLFNAKPCLYFHTFILNMYDLKTNSLLPILFLNESDFICLLTVKRFQVLQFNTNSFICTELMVPRIGIQY